MPLPALAGLGISVGSKLLGGLFGGKSKKKQEEAQRKAQLGAANLKEDSRLARVGAGQSLLGQLQGSGFTNIDPATAAKLMERRNVAQAIPEAGAGIGSGLLSGLFGGIGDVASQYGINQGESQAPMMSANIIPTQEAVASDPSLAVTETERLPWELEEPYGD